MTTAIQRRRGTTTEHSSFTGLEGEISVNTTKDTLVVHDGSTVGGFELARADGSNFVATSVDINGGSIDGTTIGASSASTGAFTTLSASGEITANGGIALGDNDKATFGNSDDLQIYHDGTQNYIEDAGTGNLNFKSNGNNFNFLDGSDNVVMQIDIDSATTLYHNTSAKLATTATGIDVTGTVTADGLELATTASDTGVDLTLNGNKSTNGGIGSIIFENAGDSVGMIRSNRASANDAADMLFYTQATGGANSKRQTIASNGDISFYEDTGTSPKLVWSASAESLSVPTLSITDGSITTTAAAGDHTVFNSTGADADFRVRTGVNTHSLYVEGNTGNVGIGTSSPSRKLSVADGAHITGANATAADTSGSYTLAVGANAGAKSAIFAGNIDVTGTVNTDGIVHTGDTDTYIKFIDNRIYGNVGNIRVLDFETSSSKISSADSVFLKTGTTALNRLKVNQNGDISFYEDTGTTAKLFWDASAESLGIGTSSPSQALEIAGSVRIDNGASFAAYEIYRDNILYGSVGGGSNQFTLQASNSKSINLFDDSGVGLTVKDGGNVGIGTSSPEATVHIQKASAGARGATLVIDNNAASTVGNESQITFLTDAGASVAGIANARIKVINTNAGSGAADLTFTTWSGSAEGERLRIDASGNVGIGVVPSAWSGVTGLQLSTGCSLNGSGVNAVLGANSYYNGTNWKYIVSAFSTNYYSNYANNGSHVWQIAPSGTAGGTITYTHAMTLDASGNLLVGTTSTPSATQAGFMLTGDQLYTSAGASTTTNYQVRFYNGNGLVGAITTDGSATAYLTSSDQRLKENITDANDAGDKIDAIQVRQYDWKADGSHQDYGMVAQELQLVAPEAVSGDADSEEMMGVDYSKLVPMLIKEIQSLRNRVAQLEA